MNRVVRVPVRLDLGSMFTDPNFRPFVGNARKKICYPNSIYFWELKRVAVLVAWQSRPDHALSDNAVEYVLAAEKHKRIDQAYVVTAIGKQDGEDEETPVFLNQILLKELYPLLMQVPSIEGDYGNYRWVTSNLEVLDVKLRGYSKPPF
jgi:hypothetical protein